MTDVRMIIEAIKDVGFAVPKFRERFRLARYWHDRGVIIEDPLSADIGSDVTLAKGARIGANVALMGCTVIGEGTVIEPGTRVQNSTIGCYCRIRASLIEGSVLEDHVNVGPFSYVRGDSHIGSNVQIGYCAEVNRTAIGMGSKMHHRGYLGDADIGICVNIAAGVTFSNFDGQKKHKTIIGDHVFIGSNATLRAPIRIEDHAVIGMGAVVLDDVGSYETVVGNPARALRRTL